MGGAVLTYVFQARAAIASALADRANFALQAVGMIVNNGFFLVLWFMFFAGFKRVGGWGLSDVALLLGLLYTLFGLSGVCFGGYRDLGGAILRGDLEPLLTQPKPVLPRLLARESIPSAWGDLATGLLILAFSAHLGWGGILLAAAAIVLGLTVWLSATVMFSSLAFWMAGARSLSRDLMDFTILFSSYPGSIYSGLTKLVAYTVLPAGFVVMAPVTLLRAPSLASAAIAIGAAALYAALAAVVFSLGLRAYRTGSAPAG